MSNSCIIQSTKLYLRYALNIMADIQKNMTDPAFKFPNVVSVEQKGGRK